MIILTAGNGGGDRPAESRRINAGETFRKVGLLRARLARFDKTRRRTGTIGFDGPTATRKRVRGVGCRERARFLMNKVL